MKKTLLERSLKLKAIVEGHHVGEFTAHGKVESSSNPDFHYSVRVDLKQGVFECSCISAQAQPGLPCKHAGALLIRLREILRDS